MTKHSETSLVYAYQESKLTFVDNVPNGKKCHCKCPFCEKEVIAYNGGKIQAHHFTHLKSSDCGESSHESIIHLLAKEILLSFFPHLRLLLYTIRIRQIIYLFLSACIHA